MQIVLSHVSKHFGKKVALDDVNVTMSSDSLFAFVGENGAGKSTLAKIISGKLYYDGNIFTEENCKNDLNLRADISSEKNNITSNARGLYEPCITSEKNIVSNACGLYDVQIVSQVPVLAESITVKENIFLGVKETKENQVLLKENILKWTDGLRLNSYVKDIGGAARFYTSLMQVFLKPFDILILDEPGAYLDDNQRKKLFENLSKLKKQNKIVVVISHDKKEIVKYADEIVLLKKGKVVKCFSDVRDKDSNDKQLIVDEIKKSIENNDAIQNKQEIKSPKRSSDENLKCDRNDKSDFSFEVSSLCSRPVDMPLIEDVSFSIKSGSVTIIKGLAESGLLTLEDALTGMQKNSVSGQFSFEKGEKFVSVRNLSPDFLRNVLLKKTGLKIGIVPSNKSLRASNPNLTIEQLLFTSSVPLKTKTINEHISKIINASGLDVDKNQKVKSLSGGMLQRLILERELSFAPDVLIMCEPLAGLDMQKTEIIIDKIIEIKNRGGAVLILSTEDFCRDIFYKKYKLEGGRLC